MGLKLCCVAWDSWGFVKKDKDRAPVIQSCVYTEIHTILTLTSLWRWQWHALIWNFLCFIILEDNAISCFVCFKSFVVETSFPSIRQLSKNTFFIVFWPHHVWHDVLVGDYCFHLYSGGTMWLCTMRLLMKTSLFLFSKQIKRQTKSFLAILNSLYM